MAALPPTRILDGFGALGPPPATAKPVPATFAGPGSADHPPGLYGAADSLLAVNALNPGAALAPADLSGLGLAAQALMAAAPVDLRAALLVLAAVGFLADAVATALIGGGFTGLGDRLPRLGRRAGTAATALAVAALLTASVGGAGPARAADNVSPAAAAALARDGVPKRDMEAALRTRLAYVPSGDAAVDEESREGCAACRGRSATAPRSTPATRWRSTRRATTSASTRCSTGPWWRPRPSRRRPRSPRCRPS